MVLDFVGVFVVGDDLVDDGNNGNAGAKGDGGQGIAGFCSQGSSKEPRIEFLGKPITEPTPVPRPANTVNPKATSSVETSNSYMARISR